MGVRRLEQYNIGVMEEICKELDSVLLDVMSSLQELSQLRERYNAAVKEVNTSLDKLITYHLYRTVCCV